MRRGGVPRRAAAGTNGAGQRPGLVLAACSEAAGMAERAIWEIATRLDGGRFTVQVWLSTAPALDELAAALAARGLEIERMPEVDSPWDWRRRLELWRRFHRTRPTLLHFHCGSPAAEHFGTLLGEAAGAAHVVITEHAVLESAPAPIGARPLERADAITVPHAGAAERLMCGALRCRTHLVPHGVDIPDPEDEWPAARAERERLGAGPARPLWLCPARLEPARGQAILLESLAELGRRGLPFQAAFVGEGSQREELERLALEAGLSDAVRFLGEVDDLGPLLLAADAVALPLLDERVPASLLEALGRARPVVASRTRGICQVVEDGIHGRLVPPGDPGALAAALESFHRAPDAARRLGENGELLVREEFTWARVVAAYESVYDDVLGLATFTPLVAGRG